jgi:cob(I)alamin adenosyltransferase
MPRLKIYTRTGDAGETGLVTGERVRKSDLRIAAYGDVDELNSAIGVALAHGLVPRLAQALPPIQNELFHLGSDLCFLEEDKGKWPIPQIEPRHVDALEALIDELNDVVGPLANFILGGSPAPRTCRRPHHLPPRRARRADAVRLEPIGSTRCSI